MKGPVNEMACWPAVASLVRGILKVRSRCGDLKECTGAGSHWIRYVAAVWLIYLYYIVVHGTDFFINIFLPDLAETCNQWQCWQQSFIYVYMGLGERGINKKSLCSASLTRMLYTDPHGAQLDENEDALKDTDVLEGVEGHMLLLLAVPK